MLPVQPGSCTLPVHGNAAGWPAHSPLQAALLQDLLHNAIGLLNAPV